MLGICFGGQALAAALGGVRRAGGRGGDRLDRVATDQPDLVEAGPWFQWHHDRWVAPPEAHAARPHRGRRQAFVVGRSLAVQFHPELTPSMLRGWLANGGATYLEAHGVDIERLLAATDACASDAHGRAHRLVDRFLDQVATVTPERGADLTVAGPSGLDS